MGWVGSVMWWVSLGWVDENRPMDNSGPNFDVSMPSVSSVHRHRSRTDRPGKTKSGTEVTEVTCQLETTFTVKYSMLNLLLMS